jgi:hypothetical protein
LGCYLLHVGGGKEREEKGLGPDLARRERKEERNPSEPERAQERKKNRETISCFCF